MTKYRRNLPQLSDRLFFTDGGMETALILDRGLNLPQFAAFELLRDIFGYQILMKYFRQYARLAQKYQVGLVLKSVTWRASQDWGVKIGYSAADLAALNRLAIALLEDIRDEYGSEKTPIVISGCIGSRDDGYNSTELMSDIEAEYYHTAQIEILAQTNADLVTAMTMNYPAEAIGITRAAQKADLPAVVSFTVETDGKLPTGQSLPEAIAQVDRATDYAPIYYAINCTQPIHFAQVGDRYACRRHRDRNCLKRIKAIRSNIPLTSYVELNQAEKLKTLLPNLNILGGCCGTDIGHVEEVVRVATY